MARPVGEITHAALSLLRHELLTARQLAERLQMPERTIKDVCYRLRAAAHVQVIDRRRERHARRPVAVYARQDKTLLTLEAAWR